MYIHLHWHSHYSLLESIGKVGKIIDKAKEYEYPAIGVTDYHGMYGIMEFYTKAKKAWIKAICGIEITLNFQLGKRPESDQFVVLIAKDYKGYQNLLKLTTVANTKGMDTISTIDFNTLEQYSEGIICLLWWAKSILAVWLGRSKDCEQDPEIKKHLERFQRVFGENLYLEIIAQDYQLESSLELLNNQIMTLSKQYTIPLIVSTNFHYIYAKDKQAFEVALAIKDQRQIKDPARRTIKGNYYIMKEEEVREILQKNGFEDNLIQQLFDKNQEVCDGIDLQMPKRYAKFPIYKTPQNFAELYEKAKDKLVQST